MHALIRQLNKWGGGKEEVVLFWITHKKRDAALCAAFPQVCSGTCCWQGPHYRAPKGSIYLVYFKQKMVPRCSAQTDPR